MTTVATHKELLNLRELFYNYFSNLHYLEFELESDSTHIYGYISNTSGIYDYNHHDIYDDDKLVKIGPYNRILRRLVDNAIYFYSQKASNYKDSFSFRIDQKDDVIAVLTK